MKKKILVVETGGTFATVSHGKVRSLEVSDTHGIIYDHKEVRRRQVLYGWEIDVMRPIYTLSENMTLDKLNHLLEAMWSVDYDAYEGIIVTHGTDTMAYTANLFAMLFAHKGLPIVMVSSNHPLDDARSNGVENFLGALDFIAKAGMQGVYVIYKNHHGAMEVHLGSRIKQMNQVVEIYEAFKNCILGEVLNQNFILYNDAKLPTKDAINAHIVPRTFEPFKLGKRIILIYPYVGMRYDYFNIDETIDGIVCGVYHSGTVCVENNAIDQSINTLIEQAEVYDIPVFIGELSSKNDHYASFKDIVDSDHVHPIYDISLENLYVKAHIALSTLETVQEQVQFINDENIFFEKVVDRP